MTSKNDQAPVPITVIGWRIWDLHAGRELRPDALTRGILLELDRTGVVAPATDRQVTASELEMILQLFGNQPLAFHISTQADEGRIPELLEKLLLRYVALKGRTIQVIPQLRPTTCEELIPLKKHFGLRMILPHYSLYGSDAWAASVRLADQVQFDSSVGRGPALNLDDRTVDALRLVADVTKAPLGLAGRLTADTVTDMAMRIKEVQATLKRPFALCGDAPLRSDASLDLQRCGKFHDACARALGLDAASPAAAA